MLITLKYKGTYIWLQSKNGAEWGWGTPTVEEIAETKPFVVALKEAQGEVISAHFRGDILRVHGFEVIYNQDGTMYISWPEGYSIVLWGEIGARLAKAIRDYETRGPDSFFTKIGGAEDVDFQSDGIMVLTQSDGGYYHAECKWEYNFTMELDPIAAMEFKEFVKRHYKEGE